MKKEEKKVSVENSNSNKAIIFIIIGLVVFFSFIVFIIYGLLFLGIIFKANKSNVERSNIPPITTQKYYSSIYKEEVIYLDEEKYEKKINDDITLYFDSGEPQTEFYMYNLDIKFNNRSIKDNIFSKGRKPVIWSSNYAAYFKFVEYNDYYFFISTVAKQYDGDFVVVTDKEGNITNEFEDCIIEFNTDNDTYTVRKTTGDISGSEEYTHTYSSHELY